MTISARFNYKSMSDRRRDSIRQNRAWYAIARTLRLLAREVTALGSEWRRLADTLTLLDDSVGLSKLDPAKEEA